MLASLEWLRSLCPLDADPPAVAEALTARGLTVDALTRNGDDHVLEIDVPANRPDCLGHIGLARELSAAFGTELEDAPAAPAEQGAAVDDAVRIEIDDVDLCARFTARLVRDINIGPSPDWVARRLEACGMRPINNAVDISNLVLLETGNPIHFYDRALIGGGLLRVRRARAGESLRTLDGEERSLDEEMLVIADERRAVGVAGVMGGAETEIGPTTRDVLIEAAWFEPASVRRTARRLGLNTEASHRFERGADPEGVLTAQAMAVRLLAELAGGRPAPGLIDAHPRPATERSMSLRLEQVARLLGYRPDEERIVTALQALRLSPRRPDPHRVEVRVPSWRVDLEREADLVEEVARHIGYDAIPTTGDDLPTVDGSGAVRIDEAAADRLAHLGFHEALGYAMVAVDGDLPFLEPSKAIPPGLPLTHPISESLARLRRSILPGLVDAVELNLRRGVQDVRLFETGRIFLPRPGEGTSPEERLRVALAWCGAGQPRHWSAEERPADLFDLLGLVEDLLRNLRPTARSRREAGSLPGLHPGQSAVWRGQDDAPIAWAGALHPDLQARLSRETFVAEIDLDRVRELPSEVARYTAVPRLTAINRDLALVMTPRVTFAQVLDVLRAVDAPAPAAFRASDRYEGPPLEPGQAALTVRLTLQPSEKALTDAQIEEYRRTLVECLHRELEVTIRD